MSKEKNFVSAVVYVHNAERRIGSFLQEVIKVLDENFEHSEVICVNDASTDRSVEEIRKCASMSGHVSVSLINMSSFHGLELSMNAGTDLSIGDFVFEFDNTVMDYDPSWIMKVYRHSLTGYDIVSASPKKKERLSSRLFYTVFERYSDLPYRMATESFRILSRRVINRITSENNTVPYRKAIYAGSGLKTDVLKYDVTLHQENVIDRREKKYRTSLAVDSLLLFTQLGYRFSIAMTLLMMFMSAFMVIYSLVTYFMVHPVEGWTTTILFLSVAFFGLFAILTIIIKYLQLLLNMIFKRKHYSFESIEKLTK
ncbi:MAG: glycosyltransferase [Erysipelotrichaceae bacterium]|nr:glycosyltransferase [Erysipelotrichaceae bacterium]